VRRSQRSDRSRLIEQVVYPHSSIHRSVINVYIFRQDKITYSAAHPDARWKAPRKANAFTASEPPPRREATGRTSGGLLLDICSILFVCEPNVSELGRAEAHSGPIPFHCCIVLGQGFFAATKFMSLQCEK
jgi:hypothetical protein